MDRVEEQRSEEEVTKIAIEAMQKTAQAFVDSQSMNISGYEKYSMEEWKESGKLSFYFNITDDRYQSVIVSVSAKNGVVGFALSPYTADDRS